MQQRQGKVLARLEAMLHARNVTIGKMVQHGFSCDAWIEASPKPLLMEIKTSATAADVHMGIGQLELYPFILPIPGQFHRVLLLPGEPVSPPLQAAMLKAGFLVHSYLVEGGWELDPLNVEFERSFRTLCGCL